MNGKSDFYMYGNAQKFHDDYIVSIMTGEPMPRKWQKYLELSPEEKARWDAALRLDAEYRIAEAQGFPNGIPGGKIRGNALYIFTQMEEERAHDQLRKRIKDTINPYGQYFSPCETDIHDNAIDIFGNIAPVDNLWQDPFDMRKSAGISASQTKPKPPLDPLGLRQAIQRLTESVRASMNHAHQAPQTNMAESSNAATTTPANDSAEPAAYDSAQANNRARRSTSFPNMTEPPNIFDDIDIDTQDHTIYSIYAAEEPPTPQAPSIYSQLAAMGISVNTATISDKKYRRAAKHNRLSARKKGFAAEKHQYFSATKPHDIF